MLTDVIMPGMNGRQLAGLTRMQAGLRVIYMSGYSDQIIAEGGEIDRSVGYLQKPFTQDGLIHVLRQVLK